MFIKKSSLILLVTFFTTLTYGNIQASQTVYVFPTTQPIGKTMEKKPHVTIWIHGTRFFSRPFFKNFFAVPQGLHAANNLSATYHHRKLAQTLENIDKNAFPLKHFYFFGWSGYLSHKARKKAARELLADIENLIGEYEKKYNDKPYLRIITHSHGGNVMLNLAKINETLKEKSINELILLACPVQDITKPYLKDPLFEKIYCLFSKIDSLQVLDPQGVYLRPQNKKTPLFSQRTFPDQDNLMQAHVWFGKRGLMHIEFILRKFISYLPGILHELDTKEKKESVIKLVLNKSKL